MCFQCERFPSHLFPSNHLNKKECTELSLSSQYASSSSSTDLGFGFRREVFSFHDDWNLGQVTASQELVVSLKINLDVSFVAERSYKLLEEMQSVREHNLQD